MVFRMYSSLIRSLTAIGFSVVLLSSCGGSTQDADADAIVISPNDSRAYQSVTLNNGLQVLLVSDPLVEKSAAALSVGVGLLWDPMEYQGMAHYLEHMLFLGTEKYPEPDEYSEFMSQNGGANNASTWLDITNYMFEIKNSAYPEALDRFSHFFKTPLLTPAYIDKEKNAVNAEWSMRREMDFFAIYKLDRSMLGAHPANRFLIGNLETLADREGASLHEGTVEFYNQYYSANIMKLAMVSDRPLSEMLTLAETYFADIPNRKIEKPEITATLPIEDIGGQLIRFKPKEDQRLLQLDFIIDNNESDFATKPNEYLAYILGSEMPNSPASRLKELGWSSALNVYASPDHYGNYGVFTISIDVTPEGMAHRETMVSMLLGFIENLRADGVDGRYAAEFGTSLANRFRFLEKVNDFRYVTQLADAMQMYPAKHVIDANYYFAGFDADAVNTVLAQLTSERMRVWYVSKDEPVTETMHFYAGEYAIEPLELPPKEDLLAIARSYELGLPSLNRLLPEQFDLVEGVSGPTIVVEEPGLSIWTQASEAFPNLPKGFTQLHLNTGSSLTPEGAVLFDLWVDLYQLEQTALTTEAAIAGMSLGVSGSTGIQLSISGFTDKQPELLRQSLAGLRINPTEQALSQAVDRYLRSLSNAKRGFPIRQLFPALSRLVSTSGFNEASLRDVAESVTVASLATFMDETLSENHIRGYLFGNYDATDVAELATVIRETFPERSPNEYSRAQIYAPQAGQTLVYNEELPVEDLGMMLLYAAPEPTVENKAKGQVLEAHLSNRAFNQLRTEEQLGYAAGALATELGKHPVVGLYIQTPVLAPVPMLERFERFARDYDALLQGVTEDEFNDLKAGVLTSLTQPPKNLAEEASPYIADWSDENYRYDSKSSLIAAVEAVSLEDIQSYYRATVLREKPSRILTQLRGRRFADEPLAEIPEALVASDIEAFHQEMPVQERTVNRP